MQIFIVFNQNISFSFQLHDFAVALFRCLCCVCYLLSLHASTISLVEVRGRTRGCRVKLYLNLYFMFLCVLLLEVFVSNFRDDAAFCIFEPKLLNNDSYPVRKLG